jgi:WXG100 family type VII secretion target
MTDQIRVVAEDLESSAAKVAGHAEELHARHIASDSRISEAEAGVPVAAAAALSTAVAKWRLEAKVLHGSLAGHGQALGAAASTFTATEQRNTTDVQAVGGQASSAIATDL